MRSARGFGVMCVWSALAAAGVSACSSDGVEPDEDSTEQDIVTSCGVPYMPSVPIRFERELVIRDLHVVQDQTNNAPAAPAANDHCRTTWNPACPANLRGRWTFGYMMASMAGATDVDSPVAKTFVKSWLKLWLSNQQPNASKAPALPRPAIFDSLIVPWMVASGCSAGDTLDTCTLFDLKKAPFRLLAFVNRIDLPAIAGYSAGGEFRVVFGALGFDFNNPGAGTNGPLQATAILEYNLPRTSSLITWANKLHALSAIDPTSTAPVAPNNLPATVEYRNQLQLITDAVVGPLPFAGQVPNNSNISHVRTNEIAFDCQSGSKPCNGDDPDPTLAVWEARQFRLPGLPGQMGQLLVQDTVSQTPQTADNKTPTIDNQLISYRNDCVLGKPAFQATDGALLGNASQSASGSTGAVVWEAGVLNSSNASNLSTADRLLARHHFGFGTCNGCHYVETANQLGFFHIAPRENDTIAGLSGFLSVNGAADPLATPDNQNPSYYQTVANPTGGTTTFRYNEPWRRACEIRRILSGSSVPYTNPTGHTN